MRSRFVISVIAILLIIVGTVGCAGTTAGSDILYSKRVNGKNHYFDHGELYRKNAFGKKKFDNVYMGCMKMLDDDTIIGECYEGPGSTRYVATYSLKDKTLTRITEIENTIEEQRVSANADLSAVYYGDKEKGIVRYDLLTGESEIVDSSAKLKEPTITRDEKSLYYISDWNLMKKDIGEGEGKEIAKKVDTFILSNDEKFIIYTRIDSKGDSVFYKYDLETGEETNLMNLDKQAGNLSISSDNKSFAYVTYTDAYFSSWGRTVLNVYDLKTGKSKKVFKGRMFEFIESIILW